MKKVFLVLTLVVLCVFTACKPKEAEIKVVVEDLLHVGETKTIEISSSYEKDDLTIENLNQDILEIKNGQITGLSVGTATIRITSVTETVKEVIITVVERPAPTSMKFSIQEADYLIGIPYKLTVSFEPYYAKDKIFYNYVRDNMTIDTENSTVTFLRAGNFSITCYSDININLYQTITVDVDFNPEIEMYDLLYVGNSLTKYHFNIPQMVQSMLAADGISAKIKIDAVSGFELSSHESSILRSLGERKYTHVILQEQSAKPILNYESFKDTVLKFVGYIEENGAEVILYQTWAYNTSFVNVGMTRPEMFQGLIDAYESVANIIGSDVVRAGEGFRLYEAQRDNLPSLYVDNNHPSIYGAYLSACIHYVTLTNRKASLNPYAPEEIEEDIKILIQQVADTFVKQN